MGVRAGMALLILIASRLEAVPPLASGDVPTADKGVFEWFLGFLYEKSGGAVTREIPTTELVFGISDRQEITLETAWLSSEGERGAGDVTLGTKYVFLKETDSRPGIAGSFEMKVPTGSARHGLGSGEFDFGFLLRIQKTWGRFTLIGNAGYTVVGEPEVDGFTEPRKNVWFASSALGFEVAARTTLLAEIYLETGDEPGAPNRVAGNIGLTHRLRDKFDLRAAVGTSLRDDARGGPDLRVYAGFHWVLGAPSVPEDK
jgi:hypothetical protein